MEESNNKLIINYAIMFLVHILMVIYQKNIMCFNHNQIIHLLFKGFETEDELELRSKLSEF